MTNEELVSLIQADQDRQQNLEKLYLQNTGLLKMICNKLSSITGYESEDLLQQSYIALANAAEKYQPDQGANFVTYGALSVKRQLQQYINDTGSLIRRPSYKESLIWKYEKYLTEYSLKNNTEPLDTEVCESLQISLGQLENLKRDILKTVCKSLSEPVSETSEGVSDDTLADSIPAPVDQYDELEKQIIQGELAEKIWDAVSKLKEDQQTVIKSYYRDEKTMPEIADYIGIDLQGASRLRNTALKDLRHRHGYKLKQYLDIYGIATRGTGLSSFNRTWTSSTEYAALRLLEEYDDNQ